ncbi:hypothetical protein [Microbacterium kyungheense]|uniref:DNA-binding beta-propeller fold protein YncE n=1 Tax=Microbacterium kyungheense TaxID=1263636 RepID=A0A543FL29_9MICO|nr:DNA-binding beta-propeller fold protein YncE [Microbacterium kyungheense]
MAAVALSAGVLLMAGEPAAADPPETYDAVPAGDYPIDVDTTPDGAHFFVIDRGDGGEADLRVYDTTTFDELGRIVFGPGASFNPTAVQVSPDGSQVWVSFYNPGQILVYPTADLIAGASPAPVVITGGGGFVDLTDDPAGGYIYAATLFNPQYQFFTADPTAPPRTIGLPIGSRGVAARSDGGAVYFTQFAAAPAGGVQTVDVAADGSLSLGAFTATGDLPWGVAYLEGPDRVLSSNSGSPTSLSGFTPPGGAVDTQPIACGPRLVDGTPDGARAYVACLTGGLVALDYSSDAPTGALVQIGDNVESVEVAVDADGAAQRVYATSGGSGEVLVFTRPTVTPGGGQTVAEGAPATFTVVVDDFWQQLQWQVSADGGTTWTDVPDAQTETLRVDGALAASGSLYRVVATSALFDPVVGAPMLLTVTATPTPSPTPEPCPVVPGEQVTCLPATGADPAALVGGAGLGAGLLVAGLAVITLRARRRAL